MTHEHTNERTHGDKKAGERPGTSKETEVPGVKGGERPGTAKETEVPGVNIPIYNWRGSSTHEPTHTRRQ